jgi:ribosomal protein L7/L12
VDDSQRIAELEESVRVLSAGLGLDAPLDPIPIAVRRHIANGQPIKAIKALRQEAPGRLGLKSAKWMVDALEGRR